MSRPWMPLYCADYLADTTHLSAAEHGAYLLLLMHYWQKGGLPTEDRQLARITRMKPREWTDARDTIADFFRDGWRHPRVDRELKAAEEAYDRRAKAGRMGGIAKAKLEQCSGNAGSIEMAGLKQSLLQSSLREDNAHAPAPACTHESALPLADSNKRKRSKPPRRHPYPPDAFDRWYSDYPHKVGRGAAEKAFARVEARDDVSFATLVAAVAGYRQTKPADREWCNPATWLHQQRWADQPASPQANVVAPTTAETSAIDFGGGVRWPESTVRNVVDRWRHDPTTWPVDRIGPPPGYPNCRVPDHLLPRAA